VAAISVTHELRAATLMTFGRTVLRIGTLTGNPVARLFALRPPPDPYPHFERIRAAGTVVRSPLGLYATTSHALCNKVLRDPAFHVLERAQFVGVDWTRGPDDDRELAHPIDHSLLALDPPEHTRLRKLVAPSFTPRALRARVPGIQKVVAEYLDAADRRGTFDLVTDFAVRVPVRVICELLGVPGEHQDRFMYWGSTLGESLDGVRTMDERRRSRQAVVDMGEFFDDLIARRRRSLGEDVLSDLLRAERDGAPLARRDLVATVSLLLGAGFETTVNLIGNAVAALFAHPEFIPPLVDEPGFAAEVVEETLRYDPPVQFTVRVPHADTELDGVRIRRGRLVGVMLGGANRDPEVFADPARFDPRRPNNREHLAFSAGAHYCLGAGLARLEAEIALRELFTRLPGLHAAGPVRRGTFRNLRGLASLPVAAG
jgi:cytochrome P450